MEQVTATVRAVLPGRHGDYAVAVSDQLVGSVTFALKPEVWQEKDAPEEGSLVVLSELRCKKAGWRALSARHFRVTDQQEANASPAS